MSTTIKPNARTRKNLEQTAAALATFMDTKSLAEKLGIAYPAAADRIKVLKDSGAYRVEEQQGPRAAGRRGARPTLYRATPMASETAAENPASEGPAA